ncbi:FAD-dependent monooxygenase [Pelagibacterium limicola]|uniref:FAD-dependent monooxygenase n=1 Tax=Pelagibacterium limicola TaxID=2791022 RepID=UPI0018AFD7C8|nr:FAD-dependent monooxygenase [Pelagibacterium limicola]
MRKAADVAVVGGGLAGKAAAVVAARSGFRTIHIAPSAPEDRRTSALMLPSVEFMRAANLIGDPHALGIPLSQIRIIDATDRLLRAPETLFDSAEFGDEAFGWNFANTALAESFERAAQLLDNLETRTATLTNAVRDDAFWHLELSDGSLVSVSLLVGADGKGSSVRKLAGISAREQRFEQSALVCDLELERPLDGCSTEFHYPNGPFTLVPSGGNKANLVWIDKADVLEAVRRDPEIFAAALAEKSKHVFGQPKPVTPSFIFPLSTLSVDVAARNGAVLVGEAAHAFPPIGAQGLNLGLRDVEALAANLAAANPGSWGWADAVARAYAQSRAGDLTRTGAFVDSLFRSLLSDWLPAQALRAGSLWALKMIPALRKRAIAFGMGR